MIGNRRVVRRQLAIWVGSFVGIGLLGWSATIAGAEPEGLIAPPAHVKLEPRNKLPTVEELAQTEPQFDAFRFEHPASWRSVPLRELAVDRIHYALANATLLRPRFGSDLSTDATGGLRIEIIRDTPLYVATRHVREHLTTDTTKDFSSHDWFCDAGWLPVGNQAIWDPEEGRSDSYTIYFRRCRAGEKFFVRTCLKLPPLVLTTPEAPPAFLDMEPAAELREYQQQLYVGTKFRLLLDDQRYDDLRKWLDLYLTTDAQFPSGPYRLGFVTRGYSNRGDANRPTSFYRAQAKLIARLLEKHPKSHGVRLAAAGFHFQFSSMLGHKYPRDPQEAKESIDLFNRGMDLLREVEEEEPSTHHAYLALMDVMTGSGWPEEAIAELFDDITASKTWCPHAIDSYLDYLFDSATLENLPTLPARAQKVVARAVAATREQHGDQMYAACIQDSERFNTAHMLNQMGFEWPRLKASFEELLARNPDSRRIMRNYCRFASHFDDREAARRMFDRLGPYSPEDTGGWVDEKEYEINRIWTRDDYARGDQQAIFDVGVYGGAGAYWPTRGSVVLDRDGRVSLLDLKTGNRERIGWTMARADGLTGDRSGDVLVTGSRRQQFGTVTAEDSGHTALIREDGYARSIAVSEDGKLGVLGVDLGRAYLFDPSTGHPGVWDRASVEAAAGESVNFVGVLPDGKTFVTCAGREVRIWGLVGLERKKAWRSRGAAATGAVTRDGKYLALATTDGGLEIWDLGKGELLAEAADVGRNVGCMAFSSDGRMLALGEGDVDVLGPSAIRLFDMATHRVTRTLEGHKAAVRGLAFSPDGKQLLSVSTDRSARLWDVAEKAGDGR